ncbi:MAG: helix-turn-helix domain-containing protein [Chloroflexi bacterium]|nr:helix-turn-helix domain-containing protein [Chloroflexota bacterium]
MQTTKSQILAHLKRSGGSTVDQLANALGLARMTVRQHLAALGRDDLVKSHEVRRPTGRPHYVFSLADKGQEMFPKRYEQLANLLLAEVCFLESDEIAGLTPAEKKKLLFEKMVDRVAAQYAAKVEGKALPDRVVAVAQILHDEGGFAEWKQSEGRYEIIDYNCVYRKVAESHDETCDWHVALLSRLLGSDTECAQFMSRGAESCRFIVGSAEQTEAKGS